MVFSVGNEQKLLGKEQNSLLKPKPTIDSAHEEILTLPPLFNAYGIWYDIYLLSSNEITAS